MRTRLDLDSCQIKRNVLFVIILFRLIWLQTAIRLELNRSEKLYTYYDTLFQCVYIIETFAQKSHIPHYTTKLLQQPLSGTNYRCLVEWMGFLDCFLPTFAANVCMKSCTVYCVFFIVDGCSYEKKTPNCIQTATKGFSTSGVNRFSQQGGPF